MDRARPRRSAPSSRLRGDRGEIASSIIIIPVVIAAIMLAIHFSLVYHGRHVASAAAQDGLRAAQQEGAGPGEGRAAAEATLALFGNLEGTNVVVAKSTDTVTVYVTGSVRTPFDGLFTGFDIIVTGPAERFYAESERE